MRRPELLLLVLLGCGGDCPRPEVKGNAEPEVLGAARRAIDAFFDRLPEGDPVCVSKVKIGPMSSEHGGWYRRPDRRIKVSNDAPAWGAELGVFHELCHATDYQRDLGSVDDRELWSFDPDYRWGEGFREGGRRTAREAFAYTCMMGPDGYDLLASITCPDDVGATDVLAWLADVYGPPEEHPRVVPRPVASAVVPRSAAIQVTTSGVVEIDGQTFDLASGEPVDAPDSSPTPEVDFEPDRPWDVYGAANTLNHVSRWSSATGATLTRVETADGLGCLPDDEMLAWRSDPDGRPLVFTWADGVLTWSRYEPE